MVKIIAAWRVYDARHTPPLFLHEFDDEDELHAHLRGVMLDFGFEAWAAREVYPVFAEVT